MAVERTLVLIKPDAMRRGLAGEILSEWLGMPAHEIADLRATGVI